jgi:GTP pyrophosphokinase
LALLNTLHICQLIAILEVNPAVMIEIDLEKKIKPLLEYKELLRISYQTLTTEDKKLIVRLLMWQDAHKEQRRKSGAYIFHSYCSS